MAIKKILTFPNPVLRQKVETVTSFDDSLKELASDLAETMYMFRQARKKKNTWFLSTRRLLKKRAARLMRKAASVL
jgi:hypothetical protein